MNDKWSKLLYVMKDMGIHAVFCSTFYSRPITLPANRIGLSIYLNYHTHNKALPVALPTRIANMDMLIKGGNAAKLYIQPSKIHLNY